MIFAYPPWFGIWCLMPVGVRFIYLFRSTNEITILSDSFQALTSFVLQFALPHIMGWDRYMNQKQPSTEATPSTSEWDRWSDAELHISSPSITWSRPVAFARLVPFRSSATMLFCWQYIDDPNNFPNFDLFGWTPYFPFFLVLVSSFLLDWSFLDQ